MRYAEYIRKSRSDDPNEPMELTLQRHREALDQCAKKLGIYVAPEDMFEEVASGDSLYARPQMLRLLEGVERGDYAGVLCMDIQRLGRGSMSDQGAILDAFKISDTKIITPQKTYDLSDETDETYTEFETFMGRQEYKMIKRRLRRGIRATVQQGGYIANAPFGYDKTRIGKVPSLTPNEAEAPIVRMMFDLYESGLGCQRIADRVNAMGAKPRRENEFTRNSVRMILQNPVYTGKIVWDRKTHIRKNAQNGKHTTIYNPKEKWTVVQGIHPAIISQEQFDRMQEVFAARSRSSTFTGVIENPLAGLIVCGNCGHNMQRQLSKRGSDTLLCTKRGCIASSCLPLVEAQLLTQLREDMNALMEASQEDPQQQDTQKQAAQAIAKQIATARGQDEKIHDLLEQGIYDTQTFLNRHTALMERIQKLEEARAKLKPERKSDRAGMAKRIQLVLEAYPNLPPQNRNMLLKSVIRKVIYTKEKGAKPAAFHLKVFLLPMYL